MKVLLSLAAVLALAVGLNLTAVEPASAWCGAWRCGRAAVVVAPVVPVAPVAVVPAPYPIPLRSPCGGGCGAGFFYGPYAYYAPPVTFAAGCFTGGCGAYWRRDCWYDMYGRRFCN